jgi:hypothetical protein
VVLGAALLLLPALRAAADGLGVIAVAEPPGPDRALARLTEQLRAALAERAPGVLTADALRDRTEGRPSLAALDALDRTYADALTAHAAGNFDGSVQTLRSALDGLEQLPETGEVRGRWIRTMLRLARVEQELGHRVEAQAALEQLLRAAPDLEPDLRDFPPSFLGLLDEARERLRSMGTHRLTVRAKGEVTVFVEGREMGPAPVVLQLPPGTYRVDGRRGEALVPVTVADLTDGDRTLSLDTSLAEALRPEAGPGFALPRDARPARVAALAAGLGLERAVAVSLLTTGEKVLLVASLHDAQRGTVEREGRIELVGGAAAPDAVADLAGFLLAGHGSALVSTATGPSLGLGIPEQDRLALSLSIRKELEVTPEQKAYRTAALVVGAATLFTGALAIAFAMNSSTNYEVSRSVLGPDGLPVGGVSSSTVNTFIQSGDGYKAAAIGCGIAAGAGLLATGLFTYLGFRHADPPGQIAF